MKKFIAVLLLLSTAFTLFGCTSEFFTEDSEKIANETEIIGFAIVGIIQLLFAILMLLSSGIVSIFLSENSSTKQLFLIIFTSVPILFFAGRFLSTSINALYISNNLVNEGLKSDAGKNFWYLINDIIVQGNNWMQTEYLGGEWIWTFLAGIGLVLLWVILNMTISCSVDSIFEHDEKTNKEINRRNASKTKKYTIETNYHYDHISNRLSSQTHVNDVTNYELPFSTPVYAFACVSASLIFMPAFTLISVTLGYIILLFLLLKN